MNVEKKVPEIRFKGFSREWEEKPLKKVASDITDGNWIESEHIFESGEYRIIQTGNIGIGQYLDRPKHAKFFHQLNFDAVRGNEIYSGDILISRLAEPAGRAAILPDTGYRMVTAVDVAIVRPESDFDSCFLMTLLNMNQTLKAVGEWVSGTSHKRISHANLVRVKIIIPCVKEQTAIGNYFQKLDNLITQHQQKHDKLSNIKKSMLEKMFPRPDQTVPEVRFNGFSGEWKGKALRDISKIKTGRSNREDSGFDGEYTFFDRSEDIRTSNIFLFDCEAVIIAGEGSDFLPKYFFGKFDLHQRTYAIMEFNNCDGKYLFYYIHLFRKHFSDQSVGSTVKSLRLPMFEYMPIKVPKKKEQSAIGNFFQKLDGLINQHQKQITKLKNIKQACLRKIFV